MVDHVATAKSRLDRLARERPELSRLAQLTARLLPRLFIPGSGGTPAVPSWSDAVHGAPPGTPLWRATTPPLDAAGMTSRWISACEIVAEFAGGDAALRLAAAAAERRIDPANQLLAVLRQGSEPFRDALVKLRLDVPVGLTILRLAALPELEPIARRCEALVRESNGPVGSCPICGSWPLLAELRGLEQRRWLRCGLCAAQWQVDRLWCSFCGQRDHRRLRDLWVEGDGQTCRVNACDACGGSLNALTTLDRLSAPELLAAEVETLHLRFLAERHGYRALGG